MATAAHRSTPASSLIPPSQATAPVYEYRCMFTHDLLKKKKKWHDGITKFHSFNSRVMVYDENRDFIGDLHYRGPEEFGEGLEFKLDKPVLIEICDQIGETSTDLTPLLGRQKQDGSTTQPTVSNSRASVPRITATTSGLKPKSIKELLAKSQGRGTQSDILMRSPYEQRHALAEVQHNAESSTKRRKVDRPAPKPAANTRAMVATPIIDKVSSVAPNGPCSIREVVDLSSDEEIVESAAQDRQKSSRTARRQELSKSSKKAEKSRRQLPSTNKNKPNKSRRSVQSISNTTRRRSEPDNALEHRASSGSAEPQRTARNDSSTRQLFMSGPRSSLKLSTQTPRPKLMYQALVASSANASQSSDAQFEAPGAGAFERRKAQQVALRQRRQELLDFEMSQAVSEELDTVATGAAMLEAEDQHESNLLSDAASRPQVNDHDPASSEAREEVIADEASQEPSNMFLTQTSSQHPATPHASAEQDDIDLSQLLQGHDEDSEPVELQMGPHTEPDGPETVQEQAPQSSPIFVCRQAERMNVDIADLILIADKEDVTPFALLSPRQHVTTSEYSKPASPAIRSLLPRPSRSPTRTPRPFRRVVSEPVQNLEEPGDASARHIAPNCGQSLTRRTSLTLRPPAIRQTTSDPSDLADMFIQSSLSDESQLDEKVQESIETATNKNLDLEQSKFEASVSHTAQAESGPWTTMEAFLLFERWPSSKKKPDYGNAVLERTVTANSSTKAMSKKYGTFGSAKLVSQR